jgi:hypothetical protein
MDRIDGMTAFVGAVDEGSLAGASCRLGCSPAAVTRTIAGLERLFGTRLLHRTTRAIKLTEAVSVTPLVVGATSSVLSMLSARGVVVVDSPRRV